MAIAKLNLVSLDFDKDNCNDVLLELYQRDDFHPELASKFTDSVAGLSAYNNDNLYEELLSRIEEMLPLRLRVTIYFWFSIILS